MYFGTCVPKKIKKEKDLNYFKITRYSKRSLGYIKCQNDKISELYEVTKRLNQL